MRAARTPALLAVLVLGACATGGPRPPAAAGPPSTHSAAREFRAAWVATVDNINWPSEPGLSAEEQQREAVALLDRLQALHFNAVILQVRPHADALYESALEPWSYYLTGEQGRAPSPAYDPLRFWIDEAHARGMELHAWLNPYRAHHPQGGPVTETSLVRKRPELMVSLSQGFWWMDPALEETREHSLAVVRDIVRRYDVDAIHFDDYFYPYPEYNGGADFPDRVSWNAYVGSGGKLSRGDWRREAVNVFIREVHGAVKREKPWVKFGLSPFGIWRPGHPESIAGFDQYDQLYADARLWLNEGWVDYFTPQLYWPIAQIPQSYPVLLGWWAGENTRQRHLWPGINVGRFPGARGAGESVDQIMVTRGMLPDDPGTVHWSIGPLVRSDTLAAALLGGPYAEQALVPATPWLDARAPEAPTVAAERSGDVILAGWAHPKPTDVFLWVAYYRVGDAWRWRILPAGERSVTLADPPAAAAAPGGAAQAPRPRITEIAVSAVDRVGNESRPTYLTVSSDPGSRQP
ncbi:MAG TPA: family 10 glycosylhydrolase [Longimicrobiales bacterium]|nr:family 10 glycosylhydrolase [Longimicrobiales bacterium]